MAVIRNIDKYVSNDRFGFNDVFAFDSLLLIGTGGARELKWENRFCNSNFFISLFHKRIKR